VPRAPAGFTGSVTADGEDEHVTVDGGAHRPTRKAAVGAAL
jgi:hypothetical protein